ncbi:MAG: hypothetical protein IPJ97_10840 [Proteobacteria bacterium]|nr:hypothetical protein [Pseudomonadota bacterium]
MSMRTATILLSLLLPAPCFAGLASVELPVERMLSATVGPRPVPNAVFAPAPGALQAPAFAGTLTIGSSPLLAQPGLTTPVLEGRDARVLPGITLSFVSDGSTLVPVERGQMVRETAPGAVASYWRVIPQFGRVWREAADGGWSRAAFPLMLVNDTENHAHQGLATFLYRDNQVSRLRVQFVQQTAPYLQSPHCVLWGSAPLAFAQLDARRASTERTAATGELSTRLPSRPLAELRQRLPPGTLDGFGGPVLPKWQVARGLVFDGTLYYEAEPTSYGDYPYPLEMRFGVRSVMKAVAVPLSLLRLAEVYGAEVLNLKIGAYVPGLDPKWQRVRFIDAANMATGFGGTGTHETRPNNFFDGYLDADYDGWYTAPASAGKLAHINAHLKPYPWEPGTVLRYRDQDFHLLGIAIDAYLKSKRGPDSDAWDMLRHEVFEPIGIHQAPTVRTRETGGVDGPAWFSAGYYPTLDDLAKIALLYEDFGAHGGKQILHRGLTQDLLAARGALDKLSDNPRPRAQDAPPPQYYKMGFHYTAYTGTRSGKMHLLPTMSGFGDNEVILFPGRIVAIRAANVANVPAGEKAPSADVDATLRAVDRLAPF